MFCWVVIDKYLGLSKLKSQYNITSDITSFSWQEDKDYFVFRNHRKQSLAICVRPMKALCSHKSSPWWPKSKLPFFLTITLCRNWDPTTNFPLIFHSLPKRNKTRWCFQSCFCKNKCDLSWKYLVWNVSRCKTKSTEIYKNFFVFLQHRFHRDFCVCVFIFSDHFQACQLAFVWACEIDPCECSGQHKNKSSQWVGRWGRHWCKPAVRNKVFHGVLGRGTKENRVASPKRLFYTLL